MAKKRGSKKKPKVPQKGDPDYLTPTQLRNRRKRRAKQQQRQQQEHTPSQSDGQSTPGGGTNAGQTKRPIDAKDPSMKYIAHPTKAPIVQAAKKYFEQLPQNDNKPMDFRVHVGPLDGWRTVAKLAVRPDREGRVAIGLFLPQTHTLLSVPNCRAHHPSINEAVAAVTRACHEVGVVPYQETGESDAASSKENPATGGSNGAVETGSGQLRYVAVNVARATGAVQLTLVWNTPPPNGGENEKQKGRGSKRKHVDDIDDPALERLVKRIVAMSNNAGSERQALTGEKSKPLVSDADNLKSSDEPAPKKRRRRGRREGKSAKDGSNDRVQADTNTNNGNDNTTGATNGDAAQHATNENKGDSQPKINLHSLWINYNQSWKHSNAIFAFDATCWKRVHGPSAITEHLSLGKAHRPPSFSIPLKFPPNVFRQANIDAFTNIVGKIRQRMLSLRDEIGEVSCAELYGGVGTIGLHVSDAVSSLVSSDENPNNYACFMESVSALPEDIRPRLSYVKKNASVMVATETSLFQKCQALILDPPRKGLDDEVVEYLCSTRSKALRLVVYVSCGFQAYQRDCDALLKCGRWRLEAAEGHLLFPGSDAIETLAFFVPK